MTRQKKIELENKIYQLWLVNISARGYFNDCYNNDLEKLTLKISYTLQCNPHFVKRVYWKEVKPKNYYWLLEFSY